MPARAAGEPRWPFQAGFALRRRNFYVSTIFFAKDSWARSFGGAELQGVAYRRAAGLQGAGSQFQNRRGLPKQTGHSKGPQITFNRNNVPLPVKNSDVNRKAHSHSMHALRRNDEQSISRRQIALTEQADDAG